MTVEQQLSSPRLQNIEMPYSVLDDAIEEHVTVGIHSPKAVEVIQAISRKSSTASSVDSVDALLDGETVDIRDQNQAKYFEFPEYPIIAVKAFLVINIAMFLVEIAVSKLDFAPLSVNPTIGPYAHVLKIMGAKDSYRIQEFGEYWRLFMPMFLHGGFVHLLINMVGLRNVASSLETEYGWKKIVTLYLVTGFMSTLCSAVFLPHQLGVGASGAIYGLLGAVIVDLILSWKFVENKLSLCLSLGFSLFIGLGLGLMPLMDNFAHVGGLITGIMLGFLLLGHKQIEMFEGKRVQRIKLVVRITCAVLLVAMMSVLLWLLLTGQDGNKFCPWCRYASCVETPWWNCEPIKCMRQLENGGLEEIEWKYCDDLI